MFLQTSFRSLQINQIKKVCGEGGFMMKKFIMIVLIKKVSSYYIAIRVHRSVSK